VPNPFLFHRQHWCRSAGEYSQPGRGGRCRSCAALTLGRQLGCADQFARCAERQRVVVAIIRPPRHLGHFAIPVSVLGVDCSNLSTIPCMVNGTFTHVIFDERSERGFERLQRRFKHATWTQSPTGQQTRCGTRSCAVSRAVTARLKSQRAEEHRSILRQSRSQASGQSGLQSNGHTIGRTIVRGFRALVRV